MDITYDDVLDFGDKIQYSAYQTLSVQKPNRLRSDYVGDERGDDEYLYSDGVYFEPSGDEYIVVAPPTKAVVTYLPDGCTTIEQNGTVYYNCSGIYYQPLFQNGTTIYQVVQY